VYLHLWDTAGQEDYDRLRPLSYPGADIVILCFSLVTKSSLEAIRNKWYPEIEHFIADVPKLLVGTKVDLRDAEEPDPGTGEYDPVSTEEGKSMAQDIDATGYFELSAKTGKNLEKLFIKAIEVALSHKNIERGETERSNQDEEEETSGAKDQTKKKTKKKEVLEEEEGVVIIQGGKKKKEKTRKLCFDIKSIVLLYKLT